MTEWVKLVERNNWGNVTFELPSGHVAEFEHLLKCGAAVRWPDGKVEREAIHVRASRSTVCDNGYVTDVSVSRPEVVRIVGFEVVCTPITHVEVDADEWMPTRKVPPVSGWSANNAYARRDGGSR